MQLIGIPGSVFQTDTVQMRASSCKRLTLFKRFYGDVGSQTDLRRACLCLRLTTLAVSLTAKESGIVKAGEADVPTLVRLAQQEVLAKTPLSFYLKVLTSPTLLFSLVF